MNTRSGFPVRAAGMSLVFMLLTGCAHTLTFRIVDATSSEPLPAVTATVHKVTSFSYFERHPHERDVGVTDMNGVITVSVVSKKDSIYFSAPHHRGAVVAFIENGKVGVAPYPLGNVDTAWKEQGLLNCVSGSYTVPLQPE